MQRRAEGWCIHPHGKVKGCGYTPLGIQPHTHQNNLTQLYLKEKKTIKGQSLWIEVFFFVIVYDKTKLVFKTYACMNKKP